jgi:PPOX class probable F420-dependent enzyme
MATNMSEQERRAFLATGTRTAKLAVTRGDGAPHVVPVWFVLDGDIMVFTTGERTVKGRALQRDPRVSMCVDDDNPPFSFVMIAGLAAVSHDHDDLRAAATRIGARYMGDERAEEFGRRNAVPEEMLVRVTPTKIVAIAGMTD